MSPEQARGRAVDKRTDIWAFGCVLYEMLTGRVAFAGDTVSDTIAKILEREPDWSALPATTPAPIRRLLLRCLAKDPKQRLRDIGEVRIEIDAIDEVPPAPRGARRRLPPRGVRTTWLPWVALVALAAGVGVWEARRPVTTLENPLANAQFTRFTDWEGTEEGAEISPDGKFVAFLADRDGEFDLWLSQVGTGRFSNLTRDFPPLARRRVHRTEARLFWRRGGRSGSIPADAKAAAAHGPDRRHAAARSLARAPTSPPGLRRHAPRLRLQTQSRRSDVGRGSHRRRRAPDPRAWRALKNINPVWSPDGQWIYFVRGSEPQDEMNMEVWRLRPSGGSPEQLTDAARGREFPGAARRPHAALRGARGGLVGAVAVGARCRTQGGAPGAVGRRSIHVGLGQSRRPAHRRHRRQSQREPVASAAARSARRGTRRPALPAAGADRSRAGAALRRDVVVLSVRPRDGRRALEGPGRTGVRSPEGGGRGVVRAARGVAGRKDASPSSSDRKGNGTCRSCRRTGRTHRRWRRPSK